MTPRAFEKKYYSGLLDRGRFQNAGWQGDLPAFAQRRPACGSSSGHWEKTNWSDGNTNERPLQYGEPSN
jgi:hypothetical protein